MSINIKISSQLRLLRNIVAFWAEIYVTYYHTSWLEDEEGHKMLTVQLYIHFIFPY